MCTSTALISLTFFFFLEQDYWKVDIPPFEEYESLIEKDSQDLKEGACFLVKKKHHQVQSSIRHVDIIQGNNRKKEARKSKCQGLEV